MPGLHAVNYNWRFVATTFRPTDTDCCEGDSCLSAVFNHSGKNVRSGLANLL